MPYFKFKEDGGSSTKLILLKNLKPSGVSQGGMGQGHPSVNEALECIGPFLRLIPSLGISRALMFKVYEPDIIPIIANLCTYLKTFVAIFK